MAVPLKTESYCCRNIFNPRLQFPADELLNIG
uniref:Uncharacterized protein n=1 Tax=Anguilla anguilla TaxID=7936 RepID=A0A0E9VNQ1_ANGAN